ncbi:hypothetical protein HUU05_18760 [candidate division KSB1 bacterium]|nr:hypothetical protein [candidate division KSB1 bacterium]
MNTNADSLLDVSRDEIVPYFMWDYQYTVGQIKERLARGPESERLWLMAKIMRDARYSDVWKFISLQDFLTYREGLMNGRLGRMKGFWEFLYSRWIEYGIIKDADALDDLAE